LEQIDPNIRPAVLTAKLRYLYSPESAERLFEFYQTTNDPDLKNDLAAALAAASDPKYLAELLEKTKDHALIRPQDALQWFAGILANPIGRDLAFQWCLANWPYLDQTFGRGQGLDYYPRLLGRHLRTETDLKAFHHFFKDFEKRLDLVRAIPLAEAEIAARVDFIRKNQAHVHHALAVASNG
jgi:aminopeptidase N